MRYLLICLALLGCQKKPETSHFSGSAFDIGYHIQIGHDLNAEQETQVCKIIQETFSMIHDVFNHWNPDSELSKLNNAPKTFTASNALVGLLKEAGKIHALTEKRFDPAVGTLVESLKNQIPSGSSGWDLLQLDENHITKAASDLHIDLDGIVKGYAIDLLLSKLETMRFSSVYVEWGGEMRCIGSHPAKRPWRVLVNETPIELTDCALATSGSKEQRFGKYTHIIDPLSQKPLQWNQEILAVTVKAPSCALADSLATALMVFENEMDAKKFVEKLKIHLPEIEVWIHCAKNEDSDI